MLWIQTIARLLISTTDQTIPDLTYLHLLLLVPPAFVRLCYHNIASLLVRFVLYLWSFLKFFLAF